MSSRKRAKSTIAALCATAICALPGAASADLGVPGRQADPVVLTGNRTPALAGSAPGRIVAFSYDGRWRQIPVQVDERAVVDYPAVRQFHQTSGRPFTHLAYADPGTYAGGDPIAALDANDEIALMSKDAGELADDVRSPAGVVRSTRTQVAVSDPLAAGPKRFVYLYRTNAGLDPAAGRSYVDYDFSLDSGDYKTTYSFSGVPGGDNGNPTEGPGNPESSSVSTDFYEQQIGARWIHDGLEVGGGTGVDILDGDKNQVSYSCGRSELTFSRGGGGFIANRSGPVRAIRSYIGANSGTYTQQDRIYYQRKEVLRTDLRVHPGINVISQFLDYSPQASGMTYRNSAKPAGVTIDGVPDPSMETGNSLGPEVLWEQATGPQGTLSIVNRYETNIDGITIGSYYQDDSTSPATAQCGGYADLEAWGSSGPVISMPSVSGGINTDPTLGAAYDFQGSRTIFYSPPGGGAGLAQRRSAQVDSPLRATAIGQAEPARAELKLRVKGSRVEVKRGGSRRIPVSIENVGGSLATAVRACGRAPKGLGRVGRCKRVKRLDPGERAEKRLRVAVSRRARNRVRIRYRAKSADARGDVVEAKVGVRG
jgi:hypothetical protein